MKKLLTIALLFVMVVMVAVTANAAVTSENLADTLYNTLKDYGMTSADLVQIERYLSENPVTDEQANSILTQAEDIVYVMDSEGVKSYADLTEESKAMVKSSATSAAKAIDLKLEISAGKVVVKDVNGTVITTVTSEDGKLKYTGNNSTVAVVSSLAIIALVAVVAKKRLSVEG